MGRLSLWLAVVAIIMCISSVHSESRKLDNYDRDPNELIEGGINRLVRKEKKPGTEKEVVDSGDDHDVEILPRTATGGIINTVLVFLCFVAFLGNAAFLVHVFYFKEKVVPLKLVTDHGYLLGVDRGHLLVSEHGHLA